MWQPYGMLYIFHGFAHFPSLNELENQRKTRQHHRKAK
jgi:hypothetical protein